MRNLWVCCTVQQTHGINAIQSTHAFALTPIKHKKKREGNYWKNTSWRFPAFRMNRVKQLITASAAIDSSYTYAIRINSSWAR